MQQMGRKSMPDHDLVAVWEEHVFAGQLSIPELGHHDSGDLHLSPRRRNAGQHIVDHAVMSEFDDHLINDGVRSDCAADPAIAMSDGLAGTI